MTAAGTEPASPPATRKFIAERLGFALTAIILIVAELVTFKLSSTTFLTFFFHAGWRFSLPADLQCLVAHGTLALGRVHVLAAGVEPFMYPPPILLLSAPLSIIPPNIAFCVWSGFGIALLGLAGLLLEMPLGLVLLALLLPPSIYNLTLGQTGFIPSALLILSLHWARRRPVLSGIIAGLMILKPQAALLVPVCYAATGQPRAMLAAAVSMLGVCALTLLAFGLPPWLYFIHTSMPEARQVLQAPWHQNYQNIMTSPFILLRSLGAGLRMAYAVQGVMTLLACWLTWRLWRLPQGSEINIILLTVCLAALATPYGYIYDLPGIGLLLLANWPGYGWKLAAALGFVLGTSCYIFISYNFYPPGALLLAGLCAANWPAWRQGAMTA